MRPDLVILFEPLIDHGLSLSGCAEPFGVDKLSAERAVEAFVISVRPKIAPLERFLDGLTPKVTPDRSGWA
jgi:hypothetical protein